MHAENWPLLWNDFNQIRTNSWQSEIVFDKKIQKNVSLICSPYLSPTIFP